MQSGSSNPYSPWSHASFRWNKQLVIRYGTLDPYTTIDPPMTPPPPGTKLQWIEMYQKEEEDDHKCLLALKEQ
eukprot:11439788-Ditylum_brightwellii.AAC.1